MKIIHIYTKCKNLTKYYVCFYRMKDSTGTVNSSQSVVVANISMSLIGLPHSVSTGIDGTCTVFWLDMNKPVVKPL